MSVTKFLTETPNGYVCSRASLTKPVTMSSGVYNIKIDNDGNVLFAMDRAKYDNPKVIHGPVSKHYKFLSKKLDDGALSALFVGGHGCGKSFLAELLANYVIDVGGIVIAITINNPLPYEIIKEAIEYIGDREILLYIDEVDRVYKPNEPSRGYGTNLHSINETAQDKILTLFSDTSLARVHKILTSNGINISNALLGRPQRIKYILNETRFMLTTDEIDKMAQYYKIDKNLYDYLRPIFYRQGMSIDELKNIFDSATISSDPIECLREVSMLNLKKNLNVDGIPGASIAMNKSEVADDLNAVYKAITEPLEDGKFALSIYSNGLQLYKGTYDILEYPMLLNDIDIEGLTVRLSPLYPSFDATPSFNQSEQAYPIQQMQMDAYASNTHKPRY